MRAAPINWTIFPLGYGPSTIALSANNTTPNGCSVTFAHAGVDNRILVNVTTPLPVLTYGHFGVFGAVAQNDNTFLGNSSSSGTRFILDFSHAIDGAEVTLTGMTEADFDGPAGVHYNALVGRAIQKWRWNYGDGITEDSTVNPTLHEYDDEGTYTISFIPIDQHGLIGDPVTAVSVDAEASGRADSLIDKNGTLHTAIKNGSGVLINRYPDTRDSGSKETIYTFTNHGNPTLTRVGYASEGGPFLLLAQDKDNSTWAAYGSDDSGENWNLMSQPFDTTAYKNVTWCGTMQGPVVAVAVDKTTDELVVRHSWDRGTTWPDEYIPATVSGLKSLTLREMSESGSSRMVLTDGQTYHAHSDNYCETLVDF